MILRAIENHRQFKNVHPYVYFCNLCVAFSNKDSSWSLLNVTMCTKYVINLWNARQGHFQWKCWLNSFDLILGQLYNLFIFHSPVLESKSMVKICMSIRNKRIWNLFTNIRKEIKKTKLYPIIYIIGWFNTF